MAKVTILDIAKELNLAFSTVARALNDHPAISKTTKEAVRMTADRLGYHKNEIASSLRSGKSNIVGILVPSIDVTFFSSVVHGIESVMNKHGYSILLYQSQESVKQENKGIETFLNSRVDGIIASISLETEHADAFKTIQKNNIPLAFFDRKLPNFEVPSVTINDYIGGFTATEHLIKAGYKKIVHITEKRNLLIFSERKRGYVDALRKYGLPIEEERILSGPLSIEFGRQGVRELTAKGIDFDAFFTLEDFTAMGVIQELKAMGRKIPEEVGVIGFANEAFCNLVTPTLSTIDQQTLKMGEEVALLFLKILKDKELPPENRHIVLPPLLKVRESTSRGLFIE
ncbi:transcriptional regulator, LacI family [bacterium A37T11]|nr:transcriptional regulator, LacI family [bacterium A37T11]